MATGASEAPRPPEAETARRRRRRGIAIALALVAALGTLSFTAFEGLGPFAARSGGGGGDVVATAPTSSEAEGVATGAASLEGAGPWQVLGVAGIDYAEPGDLNLTGAFGGVYPDLASQTGCALLRSTGAASTVVVPGFSGDLRLGESPAWFFAFRNATNASVAVAVLAGQGQRLGTLDGPNCAAYVGALRPVPAAAVDSHVAVTSAFSEGGAAFLANHPKVFLQMYASGGYSSGTVSTGASWLVTMSTCAPGGPSSGSASGYGFDGIVGLLSGAGEGGSQFPIPACPAR